MCKRDSQSGRECTPASKALTAEGVKTFAAGEQVAIVYTNTAEATVRAVCQPLTVADIHDNGKTATFTVTLTDPKPSGAVRYIYPAAMATADGSVNYNVLSSQNGTFYKAAGAVWGSGPSGIPYGWTVVDVTP